MAKKKGKAKSTPAAAQVVPAERRFRLPAFLKSPWLALSLLVLIGFGFRFAAPLFAPLLSPDSLQSLSLAKEIQSGKFFSADYDLDQGFLSSRRLPPLYPFLLALFPGLSDYREYPRG